MLSTIISYWLDLVILIDDIAVLIPLVLFFSKPIENTPLIERAKSCRTNKRGIIIIMDTRTREAGVDNQRGSEENHTS